MEEISKDLLLNALDTQNPSIMELTTSKIKKYKNDILQQLQMKRGKLKSFHKKLKNYRYCNDLKDIQIGHYIRWIPLKDPNKICLTNGALVCDIKSIDGFCYVMCKTFRNRFFHFKFDECIIFKKLTNQERIILKVLDFLDHQ